MSLIGKWKLLREKSDANLGYDEVSKASIVLKLSGNDEKEFFSIDQKKILDAEEILLTYSNSSGAISKAYQVGTLNYDDIQGDQVTAAIVKEAKDDFKEFTISILGPKKTQTSKETYTLEKDTGYIKVIIEIITGEEDGTLATASVTRYLVRDPSSPAVEASTADQFPLLTASIGWKLHDLWPGPVLSAAKVSIVQAVNIQVQSSANKTPTTILDTVWLKPGTPVEKIQFPLGIIPLKAGTLSFEGQQALYYVIQVSVGEKVWYVVHRYTTFEALKAFLDVQNPAKPESFSFPGKTVAILYRYGALDERITGLEKFLSFYIEKAAVLRQTSRDAVLSFIQLPEHFFEEAKEKLAQEPLVGTVVESEYEVDEDGLQRQQGQFHPSSVNGLFAPVEGSEVDTTSPEAVVAAKQALAERIGEKGLKVLKYGRYGNPKNRTILISPDHSQLIIQAPDHFKIVKLNGILSVRLGTDLDPAGTTNTPASPGSAKTTGTDKTIERQSSRQSITSNGTEGSRRQSSARRRSSFSGLFGGDNGPLYGTSTLRKQAKPEDMLKCLSLILATRTIDFQFEDLDDLRIFYDKLKIILKL